MAKAGSDYSPDLEFESPIQQQHGSKGLKIEIRFGDIFDSTADAIVVPEGTSFKQMGFVARHLTQIEPKYETIRKRLVKKNGSFTPWEVYTEKLGKMFQYVVCVIVPACDGDAEEWKQKFKLLYQRIFREADRKIISVLAVPLIGSGRGGASQEDAIEMAIASAFTFKGSNIEKILFVSNDENTVAVMASACGHKCGRKPQSVTQPRPQHSTHQSLSPSVAESSLQERKTEALDSDLEHRDYEYQSKNKGAVNKQETTVSSSAVHGVYRHPATNANECLDNLKKEAEKRKENKAIGDCMFKSLSQQLEHVLDQHITSLEIRRQLVTYLRENPTLPSQTQLSDFLDSETWEEYLDRMALSGQWGDHIMLIAAANVYKVEIVVVWSSGGKTSIEPDILHGTIPQLILGFISEKHYVSLEKNGADRVQESKSDVMIDVETVGVEETQPKQEQNSQGHADGDTVSKTIETSAVIAIPPTWTRMTSHCELFKVSSGCQEYQDVGHHFLSSIGRGQQRTILEINRVQSTTLWEMYCPKKKEMDRRDPDVQNERVLWHGTTKQSVQSICKNGFNSRFSGKNAALYGDGVYFAPNSKYAASDTYSVPDDNGHKYVFQARVLTGTYTKGEGGMRVPPWRNEEQHLTYDSVVDNVDNPHLYVIFHDAHAYPEYLITFK